MKVRINDNEIEIFSGARVRDALLKYSTKIHRDVIRGKKQVMDKFKNPMDPEGELTDGQHIYVPAPQPGGAR